MSGPQYHLASQRVQLAQAAEPSVTIETGAMFTVPGYHPPVCATTRSLHATVDELGSHTRFALSRRPATSPGRGGTAP